MPLIDFRYRPPTRETLESFIQHPVYSEYMKHSSFPAQKAKTLDECVASLKDLSVQKVVFTGRDCESNYRYPSSNDLVLRYMEAFPDVFIGFYGIDPHKKMDGVRAFCRAVKDHGMRGASMEPCMAHTAADDALYYPFYAACCELNVPIIITAGLSPYMPGVTLAPMHPSRIDKVAGDFPELRILISHGGYPWIMEAVAVTQRNSNVFLDFSTCRGKPLFSVLVEACGSVIADSVLFASASPFVDVKKAVADFYALPLDDEVKNKIAFTNGVRFLGL